MTPTGDCFEANGTYLLRQPNDAPDLRLVHGEVEGNAPPILGVRYGHCWIEDVRTGLALDFSNGTVAITTIASYREQSKAGSIGNIHSYTKREAAILAVETEHFGPWDLVTSSGL